MEKTQVLIIGGSAAGLVAGITARRHYREARITVVRREKRGQVLVPCGIPYIFGTIGTPEKNIIPEELISNNKFDLIVDEITSIDRKSKTVITSEGKSLGYEKLVLATGSMPIVPPITGADLKNVFCAQKDFDYLSGLLKALNGIKDVAIIGGGFIGLEFADEFRKRGLNVTVVEVLPHCLQLVFDEEFCILAEKKLRERGVEIRTDTRVETILGREKADGLQLTGKEETRADLVFLGVGVRPNTLLAQKAGLRIGETGGIWVDEYGRTDDKDIFAAGDCAEKVSFFTKRPSALRIASIAAGEARIVGANLFATKRRNAGAVGTFSTMIGDLALGQAGLTEKAAKEAGFDYVTGEATATDKHPGSIPDTREIKMKLIFEKASGEILGAQLCGGVIVGEATNILAAFIQGKMKADEIATFQCGTHPLLTPSPLAYPIVNAAENGVTKL